MNQETPPPLIARNPANGNELARIPAADPAAVAEAVALSREAQSRWGALPWRERREPLRRWHAALAREADGWIDALAAEVGKPKAEGAIEVVATLDALRWTIRHAGRALADERLGRGRQLGLLVPPAQLRWRPLGVVGMIGTWNYPLLLNAPPIAQALAAGNGVVWKPSELAAWCGDRLARSLRDAGLPDGLVAVIQGGPEVGRALVDAPIDKGVFTGGIDNGRRVLTALASRGVPAVAELSGFDAAVVLPDAPLKSTARALAWAAFLAAGQTCIAVKRVILVGDPAPWIEALAAHARAVRVGDPADPATDVGPLISEAARDRLDGLIRAAVAAGARVVAGGHPLPGPGSFYAPTVLAAETSDPENALAGAFGPVVLVRGVADDDAAVAAVNASPYGLAASVWGRDRRRARATADRLDVGMLAINDAVAPAAHAAAPFGGVKASGFGRTRGVVGVREFAQPQTLHDRRPGGLRPQLYPYAAGRLPRLLAFYRRFFR